MAIELAPAHRQRTAERIQLGIEYDPHPPFGGIDWSQVGEPSGRASGRAARAGASRTRLACWRRRPDLLERLGLAPGSSAARPLL